MRKTVLALIYLALSYTFQACSGGDFNPSPYGDNLEFSLKNGKVINGELLFVTDSSIYFIGNEVVNNKLNQLVYYIPVQKLNSANIDKYSDRSWILAVVGLEVVPPIALLGMAGSHGFKADPGIIALMFVPAALSVLLFEVSTPQANYDDLNERENLVEIKKFSRYPGGLTDEQFRILLESYGQKECNQFK